MSRAITAVLAVVLTAAAAAPAAAAPKKSSKTPEQIAGYWTPERMQNAKPRERAKPGGGGGAPKAPADWSSGAVPLVDGTYADKTNGKVFITIGGGNYVCSGTAVSASPGVNLVWTAGHCVTDGPGEEATNFLFVPGYYRGAKPEGEWAFTVLDSTPGWEAQGSDRFNHDVGAARVVKVGSSGASFPATRPIAFGQNPTGKKIVSYGYPAAKRFSGAQQFFCASPFRRWDTTAFDDPMQISCDMTGGSSGGGWILDANGNGVGDAGESLVSVNSYGYMFEKNTMYGPYMGAGSQAQQLYQSLD